MNDKIIHMVMIRCLIFCLPCVLNNFAYEKDNLQKFLDDGFLFLKIV